MADLTVLGRPFYARDPRLVGPELLNKLLVNGDRAGRIVEVEAYAGDADPGSHAFRGRTNRNATMFGRPGLLYVYLSYGIHWCANAVCGAEGVGMAVLLRALAPVEGIPAMLHARGPGVAHRHLCAGPGRLCQALGITRAHDGADLVTGDRGPVIVDDGTPPPAEPANSPRVGLTAGADRPWRWYVAGDPNLSRSGPRRISPGQPGLT